MADNMQADPFNLSLRKFLKHLGVTSQRAIEQLVDREGLGRKGKLAVRAVITVEGMDFEHIVEGEIELG